MGGGRMTDSDMRAFASRKVERARSVDEIYTAKKADAKYEPINIKVRESRDSETNPESTAVIICVDVTGSMDSILDSLIRDAVPTIAKEIYTRKAVTDPQIMFGAIGDVDYDKSPLQVTQFEGDIRCVEQLTELNIERGGGCNVWESYNLPWYFAANYTSIDCMEKRGKKGVLITMGDETVPEDLTVNRLRKVFGEGQYSNISNEDLLEQVSKMYDVYHFVLEEGNFGRAYKGRAIREWRKLLGQNVISIEDYKTLGQTIIALLDVRNGKSLEESVKGWDGTTGLAVREALSGLVSTDVESGLVKL